jgi:CubicO group peptidase (beta-lactamase class C family)
MQMLLNGGQLDGVRILSRKTVELMTANHLDSLDRPTIRFLPWGEAIGFGLGGGVRLDLPRGKALGSVGQFGWGGAATTYATIDPKEKLVALLFVQHLPPDEPRILWRFSNLAYASIID